MNKRIYESLAGQWVEVFITGAGKVAGKVIRVDEPHQAFTIEDADGVTWAVHGRMNWKKVR